MKISYSQTNERYKEKSVSCRNCGYEGETNANKCPACNSNHLTEIQANDND